MGLDWFMFDSRIRIKRLAPNQSPLHSVSLLLPTTFQPLRTPAAVQMARVKKRRIYPLNIPQRLDFLLL